MLRVEPEDLRLLNKSEPEGFGLTPTDPIEKELEDLRAAQELGVSRAEYMRRMHLIEDTCKAPDISISLEAPEWKRFNVCFDTIYETGSVPTGA